MRLPTPLPASLFPLTEREVTVDGHRIVYTEAGEGPPVLLLHGAIFAGNVFWWETQAALAERYRVVAPDFPGWGASDRPLATYDVEFYHRFILGFLRAVGLERPVLVGHSMGGLLGSSFAVLHPEEVAGLATVAVPPAWVGVGLPAVFQRFMTPLLGEALLLWAPVLGSEFPLGMRRFYEGLFHEPARHRAALSEPLAGCCDALRDPRHQRAFLETLRRNQARLGEHESLREALAGADFPVLLVAGREDPLFAHADVAEGARLRPGAQLEVIERCGHFPMWEQPEAFLAILGRFLDTATSASRSA